MSGKKAVVAGRDPEIIREAQEDLRSIRRAPWFRDGAWSISPHNFLDETKPPPVAREVTLIDITGRVIEQIPGVALTGAEKVALARALSDAGVPQAQMVLGIRSPEMRAHTKAIADQHLPIKIVALTPTKEDLEAAAQTGVHIAEVTTPGRPSLYGSYHGVRMKSEEDLIEWAVTRIRMAKSLGMQVRADINVVAYADISYIRKFVEATAREDPDYYHLADGTAGLGPRACAYLVKLVKQLAPKAHVGLHLHNDFGLGLSDAIAALESGADAFDVSINGLGEKAGQLDIAQITLVLESFYQVKTGIRCDHLYGLSQLVQDLTRTKWPGTFPIVGDYAFASAVENVQKEEIFVDPYIHLPLAPEFVGNQRSFPLGRHTGAFGLLRKADELGFDVDEDHVSPLVKDLEHWFEVHRRPITDLEFARFLEQSGCVRSLATAGGARVPVPAGRLGS
jgi:isopropylmalate/homocitrate/citramalate synthase